VSRFGITLEKTQKDVTVSVAENAKIRVMPKTEYDAKGKAKPFKPDPNDPDHRLGGVKGSLGDLKPEQWVVVNLKSDRKGTTYVANIIAVLGEEEKK
jgi:hypothetical protein